MKGKALAVTCVGAAGLALALSGLAGGRTKVVTLRGTVGPGFTITLTKAGKKVARLAPGMYRIVVSDRSAIHNFKLEKSQGGDFERRITTVGFQGTKTVTVRLTSGRWEVYCEPHESTMEQDFRVG